jgi:pyruvate ferredoxin oxidoreductase alpha subunit
MSDTEPSSTNPVSKEFRAQDTPEPQRAWRLVKSEPEIPGVFFDEKFFPLARQETLGLGFQEGLLGAGYAERAFALPHWQENLSSRLTSFFQDKRTRSRFTIVFRELIRDEVGRLVPLFTVAKTDEGQGVIVELNPEMAGQEELYFSLALYSLVQANTPCNRHRFDTLGDFMRLGAFSIVDRHSAELVRKHLAQRIYFEEEGCTHCFKCVTSCSEMRVGLTPGGLKVLGPAEDYCTTCRLCLSHCPHLVEVPKEDMPPEERAMPGAHFTGGEAIYVTGEPARDFYQFLLQFQDSGGELEHWRLTQVYQGASLSDVDAAAETLMRQYTLEDRRPDSTLMPLLITLLHPAEGPPHFTLRLQVRVGVLLNTPTNDIEEELIRGLESLGVLYQGVVDRDLWGSGGSLPLAPKLHRLGRLAPERGLSDLVDAGKYDVILSPRRQAVPEPVQTYFLKRTGNNGNVIAPQPFQAFTFSHDPLLNELRDLCIELFTRYPVLLEAEAEAARTYLADIPRFTHDIHAVYRPWAIASGHSACPTCAEVATIAVPLYMAMLLSLSRGQLPEVTFTCETGCMSETLNKVNEVAQKVKGARTVFGGGFAFAEAAAMSEDWAISRGVLPHGRRYVISQSGDGGSVIGLPAWLNALRQRAFLIKDKETRVLHFINVTDTQVYSNTGGESSASSMLGMSTLTTPLGKFLVGNQRIQWQLINLAAEFPNIQVGMGHSANKLTMQEFWTESDRLGRSAIRWDVTPCPETAKFFGEDPDRLARVMAHAGMLPEVVFVGRLRKRVTPINPNDRLKNWREWKFEPLPIYYWLEQDPRYRPLIKKDPITGDWEPASPVVRFIIAQLERLRDQLNRQIDLETRLVREAEEYTEEFFAHLQKEWQKFRHTQEEFPYYFLFNDSGELKPEFGHSFKRDFLEAILGQDYVVEYAVRRDQEWEAAALSLESEAIRSDKLELVGLKALPPPHLFLSKCSPGLTEGYATVAEARQAEFYRVLDRLLDERALAKVSQVSQYILQKELARDFAARGGAFALQPPVKALTARQEFRAALGAVGDFAIGVASLAGERGIAINRVFSAFFTRKGAWAGMAWQFGSSKRGTPVFSGTFVSPRPIERKDAILSFPFYVLTVTNYGDLKSNPDVFYDNLNPNGYLIINTPKEPAQIHQEMVASYDEHTRAAVSRAQAVPSGEARNEVCHFLFDAPFPSLNDEQKQKVTKILALAQAKVITTDMDGLMLRVSGSPKVVSNLVALAPMVRAFESLGLPVSFEADLKEITAGFPGAVTKNKKLLTYYLEAMRLAYQESQGFSAEVKEILSPGATEAHSDPGDFYLEMGGTLAGLVMSQLATAEHPLFYIGFPITPAGNPFYAMASQYANGHPYLIVDENNPSEKVAAEKLLGVARTGGALPVTFTASQGWRLFAEIMPQLVGARLECLFVLCRRALAAPALNIEESHTDFMTFRDDGAIMLSPKSTQEFVPCLYLARLLTHWARLPVVASLGGITDTHKIELVKVPPDLEVRAWLAKWLKDFDFLEDKLLNRQGEVIVHGPSATNEHYQETQSEVEKAHALALQVFPHAVQAVEELTGYRFAPLEITATAPRKPLTNALVLTGSFYPNAEEAIRELKEEGWRHLGAVSVRLFNPFPEEELAEALSQAQVVTVLDRSNSFGSVPPLASRVINALARKRREMLPVFRTVVGGLGGREITVAQLKEIIKFSFFILSPALKPESSLRRQLLEYDPVLQGMLTELASLEERNWSRHTRITKGPVLSTSHTRPSSFREQLARDLIEGNYVSLLANYGPVEFLDAKEFWAETRLIKKLLIRMELLQARKMAEQDRLTFREALTLLEYGVIAEDFRNAIAALERLLRAAPPEEAWANYTLAQAYSDKYEPLGLTLPVLQYPPPSSDPDRPLRLKVEKDLTLPPQPPEVTFSDAEARRLREAIRTLVAETAWGEAIRNPEDVERCALEILARDPDSELSRLSGDDGHQAYRDTYTGVIDRALLEEIQMQHYAPELREIFSGDGLGALHLVIQTTVAFLAPNSGASPSNPEDISLMVAQEVERYLRNEVYPNYSRSPGFYHDFYKALVEPEIRQIIARETAGIV